MRISLTPDEESMIQRRVNEGHNRDADDVIHEALRLLDVQQREREELLAALELGEDDIRHRRVVPWTPDLLPRLMQEARERVAQDSAGAAMDRTQRAT